MGVTESYHLEARTGHAFLIKSDQHLRIIDPDGGQVADLVAFAAGDKREWLSSGRADEFDQSLCGNNSTGAARECWICP